MESDISGQNLIPRNSIAHLMGCDFGEIRLGKSDVGGSTTPSVGYLPVT